MINLKFLCAAPILLQTVQSRSFSRQGDVEYEFFYPKLQSDFKKGDNPPQWAQGYPKTWGSEDVRLQFNEPEPLDAFSAVVTDDEKYLAILNGSHVRFLDLDTKAAAATIDIGAPRDKFLLDLILRSTPQGGYDLLMNGEPHDYRYIRDVTDVFHRRLGSDLKPIGGLVTYSGGGIGDFDSKGRMATAKGHIFDLNNHNGSSIVLKDFPPEIVGMSFSSDGRYLSSVGSSADLWNTSSGEKIFHFPAERPDTRLTKIAPDDKYVAIAAQLTFIQLHALANLSAPPLFLGPFEGLIAEIAWSPDSKYLATSDDYRVQVWRFPEALPYQTWQIDRSENGASIPLSLQWLDDGKKLTFTHRFARYVYDFETNVKYWMTQGVKDHTWDPQSAGSIFFLKKRGLFATDGGDSYMRLWKA